MLGPHLERGWSDRRGELAAGWWARAVTGSGTVVPDGAVDLMWTPERVPFLAGPDVEPRPVELDPGTRVVAIRLRPGVAAAVLGDGVDRAVGRQVPLDAVWTRAAVDRLDDELGRAGSALVVEPGRSAMGERRAEAAALARAVAEWVSPEWRPDAAVVGAVAAIRAGRPVEAQGLSDRQLRRRFTAAMGHGPALFRRIVRLDRFTDLLDRHPERSLAELATGIGYFDEAHLGRDCRALLGTTPGRLRRTG